MNEANNSNNNVQCQREDDDTKANVMNVFL